MATSIHQIMKAEYEAMADPPGCYLELRHGAVVALPYAKKAHIIVQDNLINELKPRARGKGKAIMRMPFCPAAEYELWGADLAFISNRQLKQWDKSDWFPGAPLLVIEVLSRSDVADKRQTCFAGGCQEFWLVDPKKKTVQTWTPDGHTAKYVESDAVPLTIMGAEPLPVTTIFQED